MRERDRLKDIEVRHARDTGKDAGFVAVAVLLMALAISSITSASIGMPREQQWQLTVIEGDLDLACVPSA